MRVSEHFDTMQMVFSRNAGVGIYDFSKQSLIRVESIRIDYKRYKIFWICDSVGGIAVESARITDPGQSPIYLAHNDKALTQTSTNPAHRSIHSSTVGSISSHSTSRFLKYKKMALVRGSAGASFKFSSLLL